MSPYDSQWQLLQHLLGREVTEDLHIQQQQQQQ
jgi:hypothetical protein